MHVDITIFAKFPLVNMAEPKAEGKLKLNAMSVNVGRRKNQSH